MDDQLQTIATQLAAALPGAVLETVDAYGELTLTVEAARIVEALQFLRDDAAAQFVSIIDISGVDYPEREKRFDVVYHLLSPKLNCRVRVKLATDAIRRSPARRRSIPAPTGMSARSTTCSASCSTVIRTCGAS